VRLNLQTGRAMRAPGHPQNCLLTDQALDDLAASLNMNPATLRLRNLPPNDPNAIKTDPSSYLAQRHTIYTRQIETIRKMSGWDERWHPPGRGDGVIKTGMGMALHTWGGGANQSSCMLRVRPDGTVETFCGTQDIGRGTRTVVALVLAETFGLPYDKIRVNIGSSHLPISGPSGGSTTVGGVSESHRRAGQNAFAQIAALVGKKLEVDPAKLVAAGGRVFVDGTPDKGLSWKEACTLIGMQPLEVEGSFDPRTTPNSPLSNRQVGGVQMAHVEVDKETGIIKMKKFVAVQDMGLIISPQQAESQVLGAVIMGIAAALFEQRINDPKTGAFINAELANYKLARIGDIGEIVVEFYEPESERARGVIGLGEPPAISPKAAISNAVANALGVRVPVVPLTPQRVLKALGKA
jgi:xanthine dehydrogenase YagR molybdenum-binding subunit